MAVSIKKALINTIKRLLFAAFAVLGVFLIVATLLLLVQGAPSETTIPIMAGALAWVFICTGLSELGYI